ncbi:MAG: hypothetical protein Kow0077_18800 [Anaerolineae bacterium]
MPRVRSHALFWRVCVVLIRYMPFVCDTFHVTREIITSIKYLVCKCGADYTWKDTMCDGCITVNE